MYIITTKDGSHSLFTEQFQEIYHSTNGAIQESTHVFIQAGLEYALQQFQPFSSENLLKIFEVGFGTGLNALLTIIESQKRNVPVYYETIEKYPVATEVAVQLNYSSLLGFEKHNEVFNTLHTLSWNTFHPINPLFSFKKNAADFTAFKLPAAQFHIIYFDAFAPENQPEMWTLEAMKNLYNALLPNGCLVSYSSKSVFRKTLMAAGFKVEKLPGPYGKREMVRAIKAIA